MHISSCQNDDWQILLYQKTFNEELTGLERRRLNDSDCSLESVEGLLKALYVQEGADWLGRGAVGDAILSAQIAAFEKFISDWRAEAAAQKNGVKELLP